MSGTARTAWATALGSALLAVTLLVFAPTSGYEFVGFDDERFVVNNPHLQGGLDRDSLRFALFGVRSSNWHPLTWLSFALDVERVGMDPGGFHATNVALHLLNVLLVFAVLARATGALLPAALVAALFAWHPLHVEPVAWISERKELLAASFGLLAVAAYLSWVRHGGRWRYAAVALCLVLSLLAKAMWVTLPLLLLAIDHWPLDRLRGAFARRVREKLPLVVPSALAAAATLLAQRPALETGAAVDLPDRAANALVSAARYLHRTAWPDDYSVLVPHPALPGGEPLSALSVAAAALLLAALGTLAWRLPHRAYLASGLAWYGIALLPVIGLVQVGEQAMADRYTYVPLLGIFWALAFGLRDLHASVAARSPAAGSALVSAVVIALLGLALQSAHRVTAWRDTVALYQRSLEATPNSATLRFNLGNRLLAQGRDAEAKRHYEEALRLRPAWSSPAVSLAWLLATTPDPALRDPTRALALAEHAVAAESPPDPNTLDTLAAARAAAGDFAAAVETARRAVAGAQARGRPRQARAFAARERLFIAGRAYVRPPPPPAAGSTTNNTVR